MTKKELRLVFTIALIANTNTPYRLFGAIVDEADRLAEKYLEIEQDFDDEED